MVRSSTDATLRAGALATTAVAVAGESGPDQRDVEYLGRPVRVLGEIGEAQCLPVDIARDLPATEFSAGGFSASNRER